MSQEKGKSKKVKKAASPTLPEKSIRKLPKIDVKADEQGEEMPVFSENEWDVSDEPFSAELLNVKKSSTKISVFTGPAKKNEQVEFVNNKSPAISLITKDERPAQMAQLVQSVLKKLIDGRPLANIKVTITTKSSTEAT